MATIRIAIDNCYGKSADAQVLASAAEKLRAAGHTVTTHGVGPNRIQQTMLSSSNKCDIMIQIGGGRCLGTLVDFYTGLGRYYHADAGGFMYYKCWKPEWKACRAHDDRFSSSASLAPYVGKTLPEIYKIMREKKKMYYGGGDTADEIVKTFLANMGGSTASSTTNNATPTGGGGSNVMEAIKRVLSDIDPYGIDMSLTGDTLSISGTDPSTATPLNEKMIINNSVNFTDYDASTPNVNAKVEDNFLMTRYGRIPVETEIKGNEEKILLNAQRGHGHQIDLKALTSMNLQVGNWVELSLDELGINKRKYYITKSNYDEEYVNTLTLEPGPPSRYVEVQQVAEETTNAEDGEETEESSE